MGHSKAIISKRLLEQFLKPRYFVSEFTPGSCLFFRASVWNLGNFHNSSYLLRSALKRYAAFT